MAWPSPLPSFATGDVATSAKVSAANADVTALSGFLEGRGTFPDRPTCPSILGNGETANILFAYLRPSSDRFGHSVQLGWALGMAGVGRSDTLREVTLSMMDGA